MDEFRPWVDLDPEDLRALLINLIGYRFGPEPEKELDAIRDERRAYADSFLRLAKVDDAQTVLDLGSGCGFGTGRIAESAARVVACDISPAYLDFARRECGGHDNIEFHQVEPRDLSCVADDSVDTVISMSVFIHLNLYDMANYFREFARVLKPGGKVTFDFADSHRLFGWRNHGNDELFREHVALYHANAGVLSGLLQFNSFGGIRNVARDAGLRLAKRRGHKLVFRTQSTR